MAKIASSASTAAQIRLRNFFDRRHPVYGDMLPQWLFFDACYRGGRSWFTNNVFRYHKEGEGEFKDRIARAYRFNHTREVVDLVQKYLFKAKIARGEDQASQALKTFWKRSTRSGLNIDQFARIASTSASIAGRVAVVIDNNLPKPEEGKVLSVKDAEALDSFIYAYVVMPWDIFDYAWDEEGDGELLWIKLREYVRDDADPFDSTGDIRERVRLWTRSEWILYEEIDQAGTKPSGKPGAKNVVEIDRGPHEVGFVPVKLFDHILGGAAYSAPGLIDDISYLDKAVTNYLSNLDAIIQDQTFSQLAIPAQSLAGAEDAFNKIVEMGTKRIFTYDGGAGSTAKPEFISPDPKQAGVIMGVISKIINEIYHTIGLAGERTKEDNAVGIDNSSGVAKAYDFERVNSLLLAKAQSCQHMEEWIVKAVCAWSGEAAPKESLITYPTTFDVARLGDELMTAESLGKLDAPIEVRREQMNTIVDKLFPQISQELRARMRASVASWDAAESEPSTPPGGAFGAVAKPVTGSRQGEVTNETE